jgi:hypothetical protein
MALYELLIRGKADGSISGSHIIEFDTAGNPGLARPIKDEDWIGIAPGINAALTSRINDLEAELAEIANPTPPPLEPFRPATQLQARVWLIRNGINLEQIPAIIEANYPPGPERLEALERWGSAAEIPFDHPLVAVIADSLSLDPAAIWAEVLAIE